MNTTLLSILLGIGGMLGWGIYDFLAGVFSKQIGSFKSLFWSQVAGSVCILVLAVAVGTRTNISTLVMFLCPLASIFYSLGYLFFFKGFEKGNVSIIAAAMNLWAVFTTLFAFAFMGQRLTTTQTIGVLAIITGATVAAIDWKSIRNQGFKLSAGVKEAILGAFFFGIFWNISEIVSEEINWLLSTLLVKFGIVAFLFILSRAVKQEVRVINSSTKTRYMILLMGVIEVSAVALVNYGLVIGDAILITPIASALSIVTIILAVLFLHEKVSTLQTAGILMAIVGIIVTGF